MTCDKHKKEPDRGYSECAGCEIERLTADYMAHERMIAGYVDELARLRATIDRMTSERHRDALEGQAALDEANNEVLRLRAVNAELVEALKKFRKMAGEWADSVAGCPSLGSAPHCGVTCCDCIAADMRSVARADQAKQGDSPEERAVLDEVSNEILRIRAINAEFKEALGKIVEAACRPDGGCISERIATTALYRAEQAKPETCVWDEADNGDFIACGARRIDLDMRHVKFCPFCGKKVEVQR